MTAQSGDKLCPLRDPFRDLGQAGESGSFRGLNNTARQLPQLLVNTVKKAWELSGKQHQQLPSFFSFVAFLVFLTGTL